MRGTRTRACILLQTSASVSNSSVNISTQRERERKIPEWEVGEKRVNAQTSLLSLESDIAECGRMRLSVRVRERVHMRVQRAYMRHYCAACIYVCVNCVRGRKNEEARRWRNFVESIRSKLTVLQVVYGVRVGDVLSFYYLKLIITAEYVTPHLGRAHLSILISETLLSRASQDDGWLATVSDAPLPLHFMGGASVAHVSCIHFNWGGVAMHLIHICIIKHALAPLAPETPISGRTVTTAAF
ncbi:hypothetical protein EVAR_33641_1 [Eumeta japonica]|uniref:Uncharacterized protein n=1 Tax=Eumeta variegata TaxID=151549 RepID=A0A4C1VLS9_EUMVA|nr:hypothetical protein EVAR_33641_1 [Eumeta japonica]